MKNKLYYSLSNHDLIKGISFCRKKEINVFTKNHIFIIFEKLFIEINIFIALVFTTLF